MGLPTQPLAAAQAVHALVVHEPPFEPQAPAHHAVAVPRMAPHDLLDPADECRLVGCNAPFVALRRPVLAEHRAGPSLRAPDLPLWRGRLLCTNSHEGWTDESDPVSRRLAGTQSPSTMQRHECY